MVTRLRCFANGVVTPLLHYGTEPISLVMLALDKRLGVSRSGKPRKVSLRLVRGSPSSVN